MEFGTRQEDFRDVYRLCLALRVSQISATFVQADTRKTNWKSHSFGAKFKVYPETDRLRQD